MLLKVGEYFGGVRRARAPYQQLSLSGSSPDLHLVFDGIQPAELNAVKAGKAEFGVYTEGDQLFFLYRFGSTIIPWSDVPYHVALENKHRPVNLQLLTEQSRALLLVILVDAKTSAIRALRQVTLTPEVTRALWQGVLLQDQKTPPFDYDYYIEKVYTRLSSANMAERGVTGVGGA